MPETWRKVALSSDCFTRVHHMVRRTGEIGEVPDFDWKVHVDIFNRFYTVFDLVEVVQEALKSRSKDFKIFLRQ